MKELLTPRASVTIALTVLTLIAFAANSVLCRSALASGSIDPASFATVRIVSGAATLWTISALLRRKSRPAGSWISGAMLALYAIAFSYAYVSLAAGTGALLLMGSVQVTMIVAGIYGGERLRAVQWIGFILSLAGTVYLLSPGVTRPSTEGGLLMMLAGLAWGVYSLRGRGRPDPVTATTDNFIRAVPIVLVIMLAQHGELSWSTQGILLAVISGSVTSGIGYVIWYSAIRGLTATRAAVVQLAVPVFVALGGVMFLGEGVPSRLILSSLGVIGGIGLVVVGQFRRGQQDASQT